jgi:hypothetical protein
MKKPGTWLKLIRVIGLRDTLLITLFKALKREVILPARARLFAARLAGCRVALAAAVALEPALLLGAKDERDALGVGAHDAGQGALGLDGNRGR